MENAQTYTVFADERCIATGDLLTVLRKTKRFVDDDSKASVLVFDELTGRQVDFNFHGTLEEMLAREMPEPKAAGPGRPKLGVLGRCCRSIGIGWKLSPMASRRRCDAWSRRR
jgi:hypothetical protein